MKTTESIIRFEETTERLKITIPVRRQWPLILVYTVALLAWITMFVVVIGYLLRGQSSSVVLTLLLLSWLVVWFLLGRFLWTRWQYQATNREVLFIDSEQIIIRRPVSILGITTAYDLMHVSPFYFSEKHKCPAFDYAYMHVYFGRSISNFEAEQLIMQLNQRLFPDSNDED